MRTINFLENWNNKLDNTVFSTIRKYDRAKYRYYEDAQGKDFDILLKEKRYCVARLVNVKMRMFNMITSEFLSQDTGLTDRNKINNLFQSFGISENDAVIILTFKKCQKSSGASAVTRHA